MLKEEETNTLGTVQTIATQEYRRIAVDEEEKARRPLLRSVSLDEKGVAHNVDTNGNETLLAVVTVDDAKDATLVPLQLRRRNRLIFPLPAGKISRIGFFLGHLTTSNELSAVIRAGFYPGVPLITQGPDYESEIQEIMLQLGGIKPQELAEAEWAEQIGLFGDLGFEPSMSRGFFARYNRPNEYTDVWSSQPLLMMPEEFDEELEHFDRDQVRKNLLQILFYTLNPEPEVHPTSVLDESRQYLGFGDETRSYGGLGLGFGRSETQVGETQSTKIDALAGAFEIQVRAVRQTT